jgi:hypothetical protein
MSNGVYEAREFLAENVFGREAPEAVVDFFITETE